MCVRVFVFEEEHIVSVTHPHTHTHTNMEANKHDAPKRGTAAMDAAILSKTGLLREVMRINT